MYQEWEQNTYPSSVDVGLDVDKLDWAMLIDFLVISVNSFYPVLGLFRNQSIDSYSKLMD